MGFLTITNYIAMGVGYIVLALALAFAAWLLADIIKEKHQRRKWEKEREDKKKVEEMLTKEKHQTAESGAAETEQQSNTSEDKEKLVGESGKLKIVD